MSDGVLIFCKAVLIVPATADFSDRWLLGSVGAGTASFEGLFVVNRGGKSD
jgi:hypothetical protein